MQNVESAMEKGEAGPVMGGFFPAPTTSTLRNSNTDSTEQTSFHQDQCTALKGSWSWRSEEKYSTPIVTSRINDYSKGYPNVAAFLDSDDGFTIFRRFGYLQSRLLLNKQEDLRYAEQRLQELETEMIKQNKDRLCFRETFGPDGDEHQKLLEDIEQKFCSYCKFDSSFSNVGPTFPLQNLLKAQCHGHLPQGSSRPSLTPSTLYLSTNPSQQTSSSQPNK
jgi:hypothetical protein